MLISARRSTRVGLLDESLFAYAEDVDWSLRARAAGLRILVVPASVVHHRVSASTGGRPRPTRSTTRSGTGSSSRSGTLRRVGSGRRGGWPRPWRRSPCRPFAPRTAETGCARSPMVCRRAGARSGPSPAPVAPRARVRLGSRRCAGRSNGSSSEACARRRASISCTPRRVPELKSERFSEVAAWPDAVDGVRGSRVHFHEQPAQPRRRFAPLRRGGVPLRPRPRPRQPRPHRRDRALQGRKHVHHGRRDATGIHRGLVRPARPAPRRPAGRPSSTASSSTPSSATTSPPVSTWWSRTRRLSSCRRRGSTSSSSTATTATRGSPRHRAVVAAAPSRRSPRPPRRGRHRRLRKRIPGRQAGGR